MQQLLSKRIRHRSPFSYVLLVFSSVTASKISLIYVQGCEKRNPTQTHNHRPKIRSEKLNFIKLGREGVEQVSRNISIDPLGVEKLSRRQKISQSIDQLSRRCRDCDKKHLKRLNIQPSCREVSSSYRALKTQHFFTCFLDKLDDFNTVS